MDQIEINQTEIQKRKDDIFWCFFNPLKEMSVNLGDKSHTVNGKEMLREAFERKEIKFEDLKNEIIEAKTWKENGENGELPKLFSTCMSLLLNISIALKIPVEDLIKKIKNIGKEI